MARKNLEDVYPLSPLQEGILFHSLYAPESGVYVEQLSCALKGPLDADAFARAWRRVVERHAVLRTAFVWKTQKRPLQAVQREVELPLLDEDWSALPAALREERFARFLADDSRQEFELGRAPLMRLALFRFGPADHRLVWTSHHLLLDGWSLPLVLTEVMRFYAAFAAGQDLALPPPRPYRDYIAWVERQDLGAAEAFFRRELQGVSEPTEVAQPRPLPAEESAGAEAAPDVAEAALLLGRERQARLAELARRQRLTLNTLVQGAWAALLGRYANADDVVFGVTVSGRGAPIPGVEAMVGLFINTLPLRVRLDPQAEVGVWLAALQESQLALQAFEPTPLARIQGWSELPPATPLIASLYVFENFPRAMASAEGALALGGLRFRERTNYPLTAIVSPAEDELFLRLSWDRERYDAATAARLLGHWAGLLSALGEGIEGGSRRLGDLSMLSPAERHQLVAEWNDREAPALAPAGVRLEALIAAQAAARPDAVAVASGDEQLTWGGFLHAARRLAGRLRVLGVGPESRVGLAAERSLGMVVGLVAILEAGGAYVPLDPDHPEERLRFLVDDARPAAILAARHLLDRLPAAAAPVLDLDAEVDPRAALSDTPDEPDGPADAAPAGASGAFPINSAAYVLYTSGSTGRPKGAVNAHPAVVNRLLWMQAAYGLGPGDRVLQKTPFSFDVSVWELFLPLLAGARLEMARPGGHRDPDYLLSTIAERGITAIHFVPSLLQVFLAEPGLARAASLSHVFASGEALGAELLARFAESLGRPWGVELHNLYGPTEAAVDVTAWRCDPRDVRRGVPIGRPIANVGIRLLSRGGEPVPIGAPGELHIGGVAVGRGYWGRPDLTAERFVPDPLAASPGARLYMTGDLARHRADGAIEFLGRLDQQVKVNGVRIEPGEIEAALGQHPEIREAAVALREVASGERRLVAYVLPRREPSPEPAALRAFLRERLPESMVPAAFVALASLPRTASGKIDRKALPAPEWGEAARGYVPPRTPAEELLAGIWAEVLGIERVGALDNFFALGGDSILSMRVVAKAMQAGFRLTPRQIFDHPTLAGLAAVAELAGGAAAEEETAAAGDVPLTPIQRWFLDQEADPHHFNQALLLAVRDPAALAPQALGPAVAALVAQHDALRLRFGREDGRWRQRSVAPEVGETAGEAPAARIDLSALPLDRARAAATAAAAAAQGSLDLAVGPLFRALWMDLPDAEARLFLAIHHLAVDGVSWRVLLEDLETAWRQIGRGETVRLPPRTASFRRWATRLAERAGAMAAEPELAFWLAQTAPSPLPALALNLDDGDAVATAAVAAVELGEEETADLLRALPAATGASLADALLSALAAALAGHSDPAGAVRVDLEGHGREEAGDLDLSRSVGWFTSLFPVRLAPGDDPRPEAVLAAVRRQLAAVPGRGLGYGLLRYLSDGEAAAALRAQPASEVSFNYLGQLDAALPAGSPFAPAGEPVGPSQSPRARRSHALAVGAFVSRGRLQASFGYGSRRLSGEAVRRLAERFAAFLRDLAAYARAHAAAGALAAEPAGVSETERREPLVPDTEREPLVALTPELLARLPADVEDVYPLAPLQEGLLFHSLYAPGSGAYVEQLRTTFEGDLDLAAFGEAWRRVVARTPVLRSSFHGGDLARPLQAVHRQVEVGIHEEDWRELPETERQRRFAALVRADRLRGFDLERPPLLRWTLVRTGERAWRFLWSHHHVLMDGWSYSALIGDFAACYEALAAGREPALRARPPYRDFIAWLERRDPTADDDFFRAYLTGFGVGFGSGSGSAGPTPVAADRPATGDMGSDLATATLHLATEEAGALQAAARARGLTLNTLAQGAWALLLARMSGERDVVFGVTVSGRPPELPGSEAMVGLFINTLPARVRLPDDAPVADWLAGLQTAQAELRQHEAAPLVRIQGLSGVGRGTPLFESVLVFENYPQEAAIRASAIGRQIADFEAIEQTHYPLTMNVVPGGGRLLLSLGYDRARFDATTARRRLEHMRGLLAALAASLAAGGGEALGVIGLPLSAAERHEILREWNDAAPAQGAVPVHQLFAAQATRWPDAVALVCGREAVSYGELARRAGRMARRLVALGIGPGVLVALCAERSAGLVAGVLAILEAGGAYLPLDPAHPAERLAFTLEDAGAPLVLAEEPLRDRLPADGPRAVSLEDLAAESGDEGELPPAHVDPCDLAYVIYTSGSTGRPKGVAVTHANAARLFAVTREELALGPGDVWTLFHSIAFDFSVWELWGALALGGRLVVVPGDVARSAEAFYELLARERVTVVNQTPSAFRQLVWAEGAAVARGEAPLADLRLVIFGGEALDLPSLAPWLDRHGEERPRLVNMYGITETTVHSTWRRIRRRDLERPGSVVGRPLPDLAIHLLDDRGRPVPIGVPGEIHVGGAGVARGYLGRPALTAERFVPDPFAGGGALGGARNLSGGALGARSLSGGALGARDLSDGALGARLYRSGDLARFRPDGDLEYLGRIDRQVKVRGFRIELGEIEAALAAHPEVRESAVLAREDRPGDVRLVGYVSPAGAPGPSPRALAAFLGERLPGYMVPAAWVLLDRLPLTPNGKVDRAALPAPAERGGEAAYMAPRDPVEQVLAGVWEEVLGRQHVGAEDDFFALGGHSLLAAQVTSRVRQALGVDLPLRTLFERPTVAALAAEIEELRRSEARFQAPPLARAPRGAEAPLSFSQERMWLFEQISPGNTVHSVPFALELHGAVSPPALAAALSEVVRRHEALRTRFVAAAGKPVQRVDPAAPLPLPLVDLAGLPPAAAADEAVRLAAREKTIAFDLARGPVLRTTLLQRGSEDFVLLLTIHHIVSDGWSMSLLLRELTALYGAAAAGAPSPLPELPIQFRDYAIWQREWLQGETLERLVHAATARLAGYPSLELPTDHPAAAARYFRSGVLPFELDVPLTASLSALSRHQGASLFMTILSAFAALLRRHTGQGDFAVAATTAGRSPAEVEPLIGYFVNTMVVRAAAAGDPSFADLLARTRAATLAAYDQLDLPFSHLVDALRAERPAGASLLEVLFLWQPPSPEVSFPGVRTAPFRREVTLGTTNYALSLDLIEGDGRVRGTFAYNRSLFDASTALRWRGHLAALLSGAAADPERRLAELPLLAPSERHQVTVEWGEEGGGGEVVVVEKGPAPIGIWGEVRGGPAPRRARRSASGRLEEPAPASVLPAGEGSAAEIRHEAGAGAVRSPGEAAARRSGDPRRRLESLSPAKRKLLEMRIRGKAGPAPAPAGARREASSILVDLQPELLPAALGRPPFFCVHAIGGGVLNYRELARRLGPEQPFYGIQAPGLAGREAIDDLPAMAAEYAAAVEAAAPDGPYLLGGWSFGGIVAFEMARQLRERGRPVALLALLDSWSPTLLSHPDEDLSGGDSIRIFLRDQAGLQGMDASWLDEEPPALGEAESLEWLLGRAHAAGLIQANLRSGQIQLLLDVYRANVRAGIAYRPGSYGGGLILFRQLFSPHPTNGWDELTGEPVEVHEVIADHYSMLDLPAVAGIASRLRGAIERALASAGRPDDVGMFTRA